jgi:Fe2+ or Zn2+ uptake regulation protein
MSNGFICKYCGKTKPWDDRDYDMGLYLAEAASFEALGHTEYVTPYLICKECVNEIKQNT